MILTLLILLFQYFLLHLQTLIVKNYGILAIFLSYHYNCQWKLPILYNIIN